MVDLRAFTRELMKDAERDLGTKLEWVAVDHWNTDNPHVHVLVRGRADDGRDLVISRDYISEGFRQRAAERVALELGPRTEKEIQTASRGKSRPNAGPASTGCFATLLTKAPASVTFDQAPQERIRSSAACLSDGQASSNVLVSPNRSGWRNGASNLASNQLCAIWAPAATSSRPCTRLFAALVANLMSGLRFAWRGTRRPRSWTAGRTWSSRRAERNTTLAGFAQIPVLAYMA